MQTTEVMGMAGKLSTVQDAKLICHFIGYEIETQLILFQVFHINDIYILSK